MISYLDILRAKTKRELNEHSLTRVYQHFANSKTGKSFAILTSWQEERGATEEDEEEKHKNNLSNFRQLIGFLKSKKLGRFDLTGHWINTDTGEESIEPSLFIVNISLADAIDIRDRYNQQAILYSGQETNGSPTLVFNNGSTKSFSKFSPNEIADSYLKLKNGRSFVFEGKPSSFFEAMSKDIHEKENGKDWIFNLLD